MENCELYLKSCETMNELKNNSVDLIITSPPYWNAIDYDQYNMNKKGFYKTRKGESYCQFLSWLKRCFKECYRVLGKGKICCVVINSVLYQGKYYPIPQDFIKIMQGIGYEFLQEIIWNKTISACKRLDTLVKNPYPGYYYSNFMFEYILIFKKPGPKIYEGRSWKTKLENEINIDDLFINEVGYNVWHILPISPYKIDHPCPFPEEIPYRLILLYSYKSDLVVDPFLGGGTTAKVAKRLGRRFCGYEIRKKYIDLTKKQLKEPVYLSSQMLCRYIKIPNKLIKLHISNT